MIEFNSSKDMKKFVLNKIIEMKHEDFFKNEHEYEVARNFNDLSKITEIKKLIMRSKEFYINTENIPELYNKLNEIMDLIEIYKIPKDLAYDLLINRQDMFLKGETILRYDNYEINIYYNINEASSYCLIFFSLLIIDKYYSNDDKLEFRTYTVFL